MFWDTTPKDWGTSLGLQCLKDQNKLLSSLSQWEKYKTQKLSWKLLVARPNLGYQYSRSHFIQPFKDPVSSHFYLCVMNLLTMVGYVTPLSVTAQPFYVLLES